MYFLNCLSEQKIYKLKQGSNLRNTYWIIVQVLYQLSYNTIHL